MREALLALDLEMRPNTMSHLILEGMYQLVLRVAGANCPPITRTLEINVTGAWFSDQKEMFSDGLGVKFL